MSLLEALLLGIIQGLTEFLPVSSSGHLLITQHFLGIDGGDFVFDVALHLGTLLALVMYFAKDLARLARAVVRRQPEARLAWLIILATIPAAIGGYLLEDAAESSFRSVTLVCVNLALVGGLMLLAEKYSAGLKRRADIEAVSRKQALVMGLAQTAAIVPGVSRSGSTITAGLFAGLDRVAATRFSFLLGIPITAGAVVKVVFGDEGLSLVGDQPGIFAVGILTAFVTGLLAIRFMLRYLADHSLAAFAYYRFGLAAVVIITVVL